MDLKNKEVIGYEVSKNIDSKLCKRAIANALALRGRHKGLVFHGDRGSQYSSRVYKSMLAENGIEGSMSAPGCPYDNSCEELFFALLKSVFSLRSKKKRPNCKTGLAIAEKICYNRRCKDGLECFVYSNGWTALNASVPAQQWVHLVGVRDGEGLKLYVDGDLVAECAFTGSVSSNSFAPGVGVDQQTGRSLRGVPAGIQIYSRALNASEIASMTTSSVLCDAIVAYDFSKAES